MNTMEKVAILARVSTQGQDYDRQVVELFIFLVGFE
jgi:predicted site-specific integrase-resolvase